MKRFLIMVWLCGAAPVAIVGYEHRCHPTDSWSDVGLMTFGSLLWPGIAAGRLGLAAYDPRRALTPLGCYQPNAQ